MSQPTAPKQGFPCPRCQGFIPLSIEHLLAGFAIHCPHCQLELTLDPGESAAGLADLRKLQQRLSSAQDQASSLKFGGWE